jgi:hypothetical protein
MSLDNAESVPKPIEVGQETATLRRFYHDSRWEGWIHEGGMGPGTPKMKGVGRATFRPIQGGRWWVGDFEQDQFLLDGTFVLKWQLHWVSGWAATYREYRASMADMATRMFTADMSIRTGSSSSLCQPRLSDSGSPGTPRRATSRFGETRWRAMTARGS